MIDPTLSLKVASTLALEAGALIATAISENKDVHFKSPIDLVTATDRAAQDLIVAGLRRSFPDHAIVAEEPGDDTPSAAVNNPGPVWCIDPLDGTTNFVHGLPHCAVSIALLVAGQPQVAAVYDPCKEELFTAILGEGAQLNGRRLRVSTTAELAASLLVTGFPYDRRQFLSFYLSYFREFIIGARDVRRYGSAALDLCYVAAGRFDGFWEWGLHAWDTAAGWLVVKEAGGRVSDFDGGAYNACEPRILASNGLIHDEAMALIKEVTKANTEAGLLAPPAATAGR
jgi:myo-inositol-1(or 4)-monophosphatase